MTKSIYLAGKISKGDWRHKIIKGLRGTFAGTCGGRCDATPMAQWPVLPGAVFGLDYTGPYFVSDDHGCFHGHNSHGMGAEFDEMDEDSGERTPGYVYGSDFPSRQSAVVDWCMDAIKRSDIVFAWLECTTCYGTLAEIGYARALNKTIWLAGTNKEWKEKDIWFACNMADDMFLDEWLVPDVAIQMFLRKYNHIAC